MSSYRDKDGQCRTASHAETIATPRPKIGIGGDQTVVADLIKELFQIHVNNAQSSRLYARLCSKHRIVRTPSGPKALAVLAECRVKDRLQHLQQCLLDQAVRHRRDAKLALAPIGPRDRHPSYRTRPIRPPQNLLADHGPLVHQCAGGLINVQPVHACHTLIRSHPLERLLQVLSRQRCREPRRPGAPGDMSRAARFVAHGYLRGFTARSPRAPLLPGLLTQSVLHRHSLEHSLSFGPSTAASASPAQSLATTTYADSSLADPLRCPFWHGARSPGVRTHSFAAQPPDLRRLALITRALRLFCPLALLGCAFYPVLVRRLAASLHASFPQAVALLQLRFASFAVIDLRRDLHPQGCAHAGRKKKSPD